MRTKKISSKASYAVIVSDDSSIGGDFEQKLRMNPVQWLMEFFAHTEALCLYESLFSINHPEALAAKSPILDYGVKEKYIISAEEGEENFEVSADGDFLLSYIASEHKPESLSDTGIGDALNYSHLYGVPFAATALQSNEIFAHLGEDSDGSSSALIRSLIEQLYRVATENQRKELDVFFGMSDCQFHIPIIPGLVLDEAKSFAKLPEGVEKVRHDLRRTRRAFTTYQEILTDSSRDMRERLRAKKDLEILSKELCKDYEGFAYAKVFDYIPAVNSLLDCVDKEELSKGKLVASVVKPVVEAIIEKPIDKAILKLLELKKSAYAIGSSTNLLRKIGGDLLSDAQLEELHSAVADQEALLDLAEVKPAILDVDRLTGTN